MIDPFLNPNAPIQSGYSAGASNTALVNSAYAVGDTTVLNPGTYLVLAMFSAISITINTSGRVFFGLSVNSGAYVDLIQIKFFKTDGTILADAGNCTVMGLVSFADTDTVAARTVACRGQVALGAAITGTFSSQMFWQRIGQTSL